jgi:hypothetical protein
MQVLFSDIIKGNYDENKIYRIKYDAIVCEQGCCHSDTIREIKITGTYKDDIKFTDIHNRCGYMVPINRIYICVVEHP